MQRTGSKRKRGKDGGEVQEVGQMGRAVDMDMG